MGQVILKRERAIKEVCTVLDEVFVLNGDSYPIKCVEFAKEIVDRLWARFDLIESNLKAYQKMDEIEGKELLPMKYRMNYFLDKSRMPKGLQ